MATRDSADVAALFEDDGDVLGFTNKLIDLLSFQDVDVMDLGLRRLDLEMLAT